MTLVGGSLCPEDTWRTLDGQPWFEAPYVARKLQYHNQYLSDSVEAKVSSFFYNINYTTEIFDPSPVAAVACLYVLLRRQQQNVQASVKLALNLLPRSEQGKQRKEKFVNTTY